MNNGTMRGFSEFTNDAAGQSEATMYYDTQVGRGMRVKMGRFPSPNDNILVKWYNPRHFRSFEVPKRKATKTGG